MDEAYFLQVLSMFFFSVWKTYIGPLIAVGAQFSYAEMLLFNMGPALASAGATLFATDYWLARRQSKPKGFNRNLRKVMRFWKRYGRRGTLVLAPVLLGVPSYALIARRLRARRLTIMLELTVITFVWCSLVYFAGREGLLLVEAVI